MKRITLVQTITETRHYSGNVADDADYDTILSQLYTKKYTVIKTEEESCTLQDENGKLIKKPIVVKTKLTPDLSHSMSTWENATITFASTPRFGVIRSCTKCQAEHAQTAAGEQMMDELYKKCTG